MLTKKNLRQIFFSSISLLLSSCATHQQQMHKRALVNKTPLNQIDTVVEHAISKEVYPGAVVWASHKGVPIYQKAFGNRRIDPDIAPMCLDTIFDVASLTKVVVTTTAIMQLIEQGKIRLDQRLSTLWPEFTGHGKEAITIQDLLTHTAGFQPCPPRTLKNKAEVLQWIAQSELNDQPGSHFIYDDISFAALGYLIERITRQPLNEYAQKCIFDPLEMKESMFLPSTSLLDRIAPTERINGVLHWGMVHDPTTAAMGGVAGVAGLFSTACDLGIFLDCILEEGRIPGKQQNLLYPHTIQQMTKVQTPSTIPEKRGLGWDICSMPFGGGRSELFSPNAFGHTGFTGTSMWADPETKSWVILLANRVHPIYKPDDKQIFKDRVAIADVVAGYLYPPSTARFL